MFSLFIFQEIYIYGFPKIGVPLNHHFKKMFAWNSSILGYSRLWKPPWIFPWILFSLRAGPQAMPAQSKPGPMFAVVAGTRTVTRLPNEVCRTRSMVYQIKKIALYKTQVFDLFRICENVLFYFYYYIYICVCVCLYTHIYIYIYWQRNDLEIW